MNIRMTFYSILMSVIYIQSLSAMLIRSAILTPKLNRISGLIQNKRFMTTNINIPKVTSETNSKYLDRYPLLNFLPSNSILRAKCEEEAQRTDELYCIKYHNVAHITSPLKPVNSGSELLWDLNQRLEYSLFRGKQAQINDLVNLGIMFKICFATYISSACLLMHKGVYHDFSMLDNILLCTMGSTYVGTALLGFTGANQIETNRSIMHKLFKNNSKEIQKKALLEYYQLSDNLVAEWKKNKESKAIDESPN